MPQPIHPCEGKRLNVSNRVIGLCVACDRFQATPLEAGAESIQPRAMQHPQWGNWACSDRVVDGRREVREAA